MIFQTFTDRDLVTKRMVQEKTMFVGIIISFYSLIASITFVCSSHSISRLHYKDIVDASYESCVVTIPETLVDERALSLLSSAAEVFKSDPKVAFYFVDFSDAKGFHRVLPASKIDRENSVFVFKLLRKDRTCLLTPVTTVENLQKPSVYSFQKDTDTDYDLGNIVNFLNENCLTFRKANGELTPQGIHEEYILSNLFSVSKPKDTVTDTEVYSDLGEIGDGSFCAANSNDNDHDQGHDCTTVRDSDETYKSQEPKIMHHCERIPLPSSSSEFLNEYLTLSKPVVITGATSHWPVFKKWKNQYLREKYGDIKVHIKITPNGEYEGVESTAIWGNKSKVKIPQDVLKQLPFPDLVVVRPATMEINFSEFIHLIESIASSKSSNISAYLEYSSITYFPDLEKDISEMSFIDGVLDLQHTNVWLSDGNTVGKLHFDPFDNFMCQISGEKEFILYDPHGNERLYEAHIQEAVLSYNSTARQFSRHKLMESTSMVMSPIDIEKPDMKRFPKFSQTEAMSCKIQPGDVLFTPAFWWHEVRSQPNKTEHRNLAVNFWYDPFFLKEFPCPECRLYINPKYFHLL